VGASLGGQNPLCEGHLVAGHLVPPFLFKTVSTANISLMFLLEKYSASWRRAVLSTEGTGGRTKPLVPFVPAASVRTDASGLVSLVTRTPGCDSRALSHHRMSRRMSFLS
jgi:hypothetical protein